MVNCSASVLGWIVQRNADELLGYQLAGGGDTETEKIDIALDAITGGAFGLVGGKAGDKLFPIPNVQKEIGLLRFAHRRFTRSARVQGAQKNGERQALFNSGVNGVAGEVPTEGSKMIWQWFWSVTPVPKKQEPNT